MLLLQLLNAPLRVSNELIWSEYTAPYDLELKCVSAGGCLVSNTKKDDLSSSCAELLSFGGIVALDFSYFHSPLQGVSITAQGTGASFEGIAAVKSQTYMPLMEESDNEGILDMWHNIYPGTTLLNMVRTHNKTLSEKNRRRVEYFGIASDTSSAVISGSTPCVSPSSWPQVVQARIRLQQSANVITVSSTFSLPSWAGASFGTYAALLSIGGYVLSTLEAERVQALGRRADRAITPAVTEETPTKPPPLGLSI
jgi:hypothetical protein